MGYLIKLQNEDLYLTDGGWGPTFGPKDKAKKFWSKNSAEAYRKKYISSFKTKIVIW